MRFKLMWWLAPPFLKGGWEGFAVPGNLPMSMPAALGWVMVRAAARDLPALRLMLRLRCAMACSIIRSGMWRRIGYVVLLTLLNGISIRRLNTAKPIHQCR